MPDSPYKEFRKDGWPLCPQCGEDELYSHAMIAFFGTGEPPSVGECIAGGMRCYRCDWDSERAAANGVLAELVKAARVRAQALLN
jgi:hypothetical protein